VPVPAEGDRSLFPAKMAFRTSTISAGEAPKKAAERSIFPMYDVLHSPLVKIVGANRANGDGDSGT